MSTRQSSNSLHLGRAACSIPEHDDMQKRIERLKVSFTKFGARNVCRLFLTIDTQKGLKPERKFKKSGKKIFPKPSCPLKLCPIRFTGFPSNRKSVEIGQKSARKLK